MLEKIYTYLKSVGTTPEELVLKWIESGRIDLNKITELAKQDAQNKNSEIKKINDVEAGMFLTERKKICRQFDAEKCVAIVLKPDYEKKTALVMNIAGESLTFSREGVDVDTLGLSGINATHFIKQMALEQKVTVDAADYCLEFKNSFVQQGNAFLLNKEEIEALAPDFDKIYQAFFAAKISDGTFWTSSTPANKLQDNDTQRTAYIFNLRGSKIVFHSEYIRLPFNVHPAYEVNLRDFL